LRAAAALNGAADRLAGTHFPCLRTPSAISALLCADAAEDAEAKATGLDVVNCRSILWPFSHSISGLLYRSETIA